MAELESYLQRKCQKLLKEEGNAFVFKTHGDIYGRVGIPDLVACIPVTKEVVQSLLDEGYFDTGKIGIFTGLEIKRKDLLRNVSEAQKIVGREIRDAGGLWYSIDDTETLLALLMKLKGVI